VATEIVAVPGRAAPPGTKGLTFRHALLLAGTAAMAAAGYTVTGPRAPWGQPGWPHRPPGCPPCLRLKLEAALTGTGGAMGSDMEPPQPSEHGLPAAGPGDTSPGSQDVQHPDAETSRMACGTRVQRGPRPAAAEVARRAAMPLRRPSCRPGPRAATHRDMVVESRLPSLPGIVVPVPRGSCLAVQRPPPKDAATGFSRPRDEASGAVPRRRPEK